MKLKKAWFFFNYHSHNIFPSVLEAPFFIFNEHDFQFSFHEYDALNNLQFLSNSYFSPSFPLFFFLFLYSQTSAEKVFQKSRVAAFRISIDYVGFFLIFKSFLKPS